MTHLADGIPLEEIAQASREQEDEPLMVERWRRRHEQLAVDDLVTIAVVGDGVEAIHGPAPRRGHVRHPLLSHGRAYARRTSRSQALPHRGVEPALKRLVDTALPLDF